MHFFANVTASSISIKALAIAPGPQSIGMAKGRNGNVVHICLHLLLFQLGFRIACLQHVETDREDDNAPPQYGTRLSKYRKT